MSYLIHQGDALEVLRGMESESVNCCVTSPPYFGLRNYGYDGQIGLEDTPEEFVSKLVAVFREVLRVLRADGTCWINIGDSYASAWPCSRRNKIGSGSLPDGKLQNRPPRLGVGLKEKDLIGVPWMLAFALRADGWYLRQDIIWNKPNPMPESVRDRCTKAHEYIFLLTKSYRYTYDAEAIAEQAIFVGDQRHLRTDSTSSVRFGESGRRSNGKPQAVTRNKRSVWSMATLPTPDAHFATFPIELPEMCILAGCPPEGKRCNCEELIATPLGTGESDDPTKETGRAGMNRARRIDEGTRPITRLEQRHYAQQIKESGHKDRIREICGPGFDHYVRTDASGARPIPPDSLNHLIEAGLLVPAPKACSCPVDAAGIVLDPFAGAGTTGLAALKNGRRFVGIELNPEYIEIAKRRAERHYPLLAVPA
jgi:DNA modification methylase